MHTYTSKCPTVWEVGDSHLAFDASMADRIRVRVVHGHAKEARRKAVLQIRIRLECQDMTRAELLTLVVVVAADPAGKKRRTERQCNSIRLEKTS
ncbi:unnamed protein product [Soboliphyme baturini]|uniref:Transposase n=1 Tax=Soboliphyme baturini TaxID=241478 RepID=A0A183IDT3_9BILA|nr:unnamed protein product [Soboliphyme baturini]